MSSGQRARTTACSPREWESVLSLTYLSSAVELWTDDELARLLHRARAKNEETGITGMLLYAGGNFIQTLEGPSDEVDALFALIDSDSRHDGVFLVRREDIDERMFAAWHMGFKEISAQDAHEVPGFTDYLETGRIDGEEPRRSAVATFHRVFRQHIR